MTTMTMMMMIIIIINDDKMTIVIRKIKIKMGYLSLLSARIGGRDIEGSLSNHITHRALI